MTGRGFFFSLTITIPIANNKPATVATRAINSAMGAADRICGNDCFAKVRSNINSPLPLADHVGIAAPN